MEIFDLYDIPAHKLAEAGGKAKGLFNISRLGLNVPKGFVLINCETEKDIETAAKYFLLSGIKYAAVRSSATAEDGEDFSGAGQYTTYLNISGAADFKKAVRDCLDSLENSVAASYTSYFKQAESAKMSVVVQEMVEAAYAGVCFTRDPADPSFIMTEAVQGLGEALVSGEAKSAQFRLQSDNLTEEEARKACADQSVVSPEILLGICRQAKALADAEKRDLDTEWAVSDEGILYWLQARPITVTASAEIGEFDRRLSMEGRVITKCNIGEMLPGAVTPLTLSTSVDAIDRGMRRMLVKAGVFKHIEEVPEQSCAFGVSNNLFMDLSTLYAMEGAIIGADVNSVNLSLCGKLLDEKGEAEIRYYSKFKRVINMGKYFGFLLSRNKARKKLTKLADTLSVGSGADTAEKLYADINGNLQKYYDSVWYHYITSAHSGAMSSATYMILDSKFNNSEQTKGILASLLENIDDIESVDILRSFRAVAAALLKENPAVKDFTPDEIGAYLKKCGLAAAEKYAQFMKRHGHRAIREAEMRSMGWAQNEKAFNEYLMTVISSGAREMPKAQTRGYKEIIAGLDIKGGKKKALNYLAGQARQGVRNREYSKSKFIKTGDIFKRAYSDLGSMLEKAGALPDADLIYFLTHKEIGTLITEKKYKLIKTAMQRRRLLDEQMSLHFNEVYVGKPEAVKNSDAAAAEGAVLSGAPVSRGIATGVARVIRGIDDAKRLQKGEIMVAAYTDIGWSPYYCLISGLVTEVGSALSHGAVVAREYALPLVANVNNATRLIRTGDRIALDGAAGTVTILQEAEAQAV